MRWTRVLCEVVRNTGSTARDHLANERTFLSYSRTGLAFLGASAGLFSAYSLAGSNQHREDPVFLTGEVPRRVKEVLPGCFLLFLNSVGFLSFATYNYHRITNELIKGNFLINRKGVFALTTLTSISTVLAVFSIVVPNDHIWFISRVDRYDDHHQKDPYENPPWETQPSSKNKK